MPQPGDTPDPEPHGDRREATAPKSPGSPRGAGGGKGRGRWNRRLVLTGVAVSVAVAGAVPVAWGVFSGPGEKPKQRSESLSGPANTAPVADFDDDGVQDVHATGEFGGGVSVAYGSGKGGSGGEEGKERRQRLDLDSPGVPGKEGRDVSFADSTAARDIDADGYTDLVATVEAPSGEGKETKRGLMALWGSKKGLSGGTYLKDVDGVLEHTDDDPVVAGDMTGDGKTDLVVSIGSEHGLLKGPFSRDGAPSGTSAVPTAFADDDTDSLTAAIAADLNGDGTDDLVSSHETENDGLGGGQVETAYAAGGPDGFAKPDAQLLPGIETVTTGDVDKDGYTDVVMRRYPKGTAPDSVASGPVEVFHGSKKGPDPSRHTEIDQDSPGVPGEKQDPSLFGSALDAGDANGDGYADVVAGEHVEKDDKTERSTATVLLGGSKGLTGRGARAVEEPSSAPPPEADMGNRFGDAVKMGDLNGDGKSDLAVGASSTSGYEGALWIFPAGKEGWPEDDVRKYGPRDFGDPDAPDDDEIGAEVH